jgi:glycosyltransferase involved in cell wall biosynthesis
MNPRPLILIDTGIIGGPGRGLLQLASFLEGNKLNYLICTFSYRAPKSREFQDELRKQNLCADTIRQSSLCDPTPVYDFLRTTKRGRFNIIQSHGYKSHLVALLVSRILGVPWVAFAHGWTTEDPKVMLYHSLDKVMLRFAECVVTVSPTLHDIFSRIRGPKRRTRLILNAVDSSLISGAEGGEALRVRYCGTESSVLIGCFGRLSSEKGQDILLEALAMVAETHPHVSLLFVGDGPEREALQKRSEELGLTARVFFQAHTTAIRDCYEAIDLLVLPSRSEGLPNVVLEALSLGVPVVATDVGAIGEVITHRKTGWMVPPNSPEELARGIQEALSDEGLRATIADAGKRLVVEKFSPATRGETIVALYRETLRTQHGGDIIHPTTASRPPDSLTSSPPFTL